MFKNFIYKSKEIAAALEEKIKIEIENEILNGISGKNPEIFEYPCKLDPPALLKVWEGTKPGCACFSCERDGTILLNHDQVDALILQLQKIQSNGFNSSKEQVINFLTRGES